MKVLLAENAGFCFGVKLAIDSAIKTQNEYNKKIYRCLVFIVLSLKL